MTNGKLDDFIERLRGPVPGTPAVLEQLRIAGNPVLVRFGSPALAERLTRSVRHLRQGFSSPPDLVIDCWSTEQIPAAGFAGESAEAGMFHLEREGIQLTWDSPDGPLAIYDPLKSHAWMRFGPVDSVSNYEVARPFRKILHWWAADRSLQMIHAGAIGSARGGVLLAGPSGSGKSTTALACLAGGLQYAADDYCLVEPGKLPQVHSLYTSGVANARTADLVPTLRHALLSAPCMPGYDSAKHLIFSDEVAPASATLGFPLRAILVPRVTGGNTSRLEPLSPAESLRALAPSTLLQLPGQRAEGLARLAKLVRAVPSWRLCLGGDPRTAVDLLADLLARHGEPDACPQIQSSCQA
ncbi:MAG: hypothetical protein WEB53_02345 [Akkermansiaceae bacterium]